MADEVSRAVLNRVRVEWIAAAFGLLTGITMVYVPYEFGTSIFQVIYPHIRLLGTVFMAGSAAMLVALLYPAWPRWVGDIGRVLLILAIGVYWWGATILVGGWTGTTVYPMLVLALVAERIPRWHARGLFPVFLLGTALAFGVFLLVDPSLLGPSFYPVYRPVARPMGLLFFVMGGLLTWGMWRRSVRIKRLAVGVLTLLFGQMAVVAGVRESWPGLVLYGVISFGCVLVLFLRWTPETSTMGWRLFRGVALASVLPILAVGGLASMFAQRAIAMELRDKAQQAVAAEVAWLEQTASMARFVILTQTRDPSLSALLSTRQMPGLSARMELLQTQPGPFDGAWMLDERGDSIYIPAVASSLPGNFSYRDYFQQGREVGRVYLSRPFLSASQVPMVTFSAPILLDSGERVVLVGGMSLPRLNHESTLASRNYHVEIFDRRGGELLRETHRGELLTRAPILSLLDAPVFSAAEGLAESMDTQGRRLLVAHAQVPDTPWTVVVTAPLRQAFAPVTRLSALVVFIALVAGAVSLVLSRWVGRDVAQRLTALRDGFAALGTLTLDRRVSTRGDDELTELASGFNEMAARIERTQTELREAISSRDQFLSMASHELRTPLTPLKASIELLVRQYQGMSPDKQRATLERLRRQVDRLTRLIGDMLDVSRLQSGRFALKLDTLDLSALAREVVERVVHSRTERSAPIHLELPEQPLVGVWDDQRLDQLLTNLVENAVRYSPPDKPIHVRLGPEGHGVRIEVEDQGIGVPAESLSRLFEPFFRAQNAAEHHAGGLGLGLAICQEIVQRHGGTLHATSPGPGQGTCFSVYLPRDEAPAPA